MTKVQAMTKLLRIAILIQRVRVGSLPLSALDGLEKELEEINDG